MYHNTESTTQALYCHNSSFGTGHSVLLVNLLFIEGIHQYTEANTSYVSYSAEPCKIYARGSLYVWAL